MTAPKNTDKIVHLYFNKDFVNEVDMYILTNKADEKNPSGRKYSRNDFMIEAADAYAEKLGLKTRARDLSKGKE